MIIIHGLMYWSCIYEVHNLKIGTHEIYNDNFPWLWLDIYNELNDAARKEWALIGKNASTNALKVKVTSKKIYQVPLHLPGRKFI